MKKLTVDVSSKDVSALCVKLCRNILAQKLIKAYEYHTWYYASGMEN
jgi:hypothetical protein